jgi:putative PIN family toxin of toxin-antitoxin system
MRIVLDANVLVSSYISRGVCFDLVYYVFKNHRSITSEMILVEVARYLRTKTKLPIQQVDQMVEVIRLRSVLAIPSLLSADVCRDPHDVHVLGLAIAAQADLIITGDQDLLVLKSFKGIPVLSPREAWLRLRAV